MRVLVPRKSDVRIVQWAAQAAYANLLMAGVIIHKYRPRMLHAKTVIIDGRWSSVGTSNIDYRSFFLNFELNLASDNDELAVALERQFQDDLAESDQIHLKHWLKRSWYSRVLEFIGWLARRWL